VQEIKGKRKP